MSARLATPFNSGLDHDAIVLDAELVVPSSGTDVGFGDGTYRRAVASLRLDFHEHVPFRPLREPLASFRGGSEATASTQPAVIVDDEAPATCSLPVLVADVHGPRMHRRAKPGLARFVV
jgi:hypothetical protein